MFHRILYLTCDVLDLVDAAAKEAQASVCLLVQMVFYYVFFPRFKVEGIRLLFATAIVHILLIIKICFKKLGFWGFGEIGRAHV